MENCNLRNFSCLFLLFSIAFPHQPDRSVTFLHNCKDLQQRKFLIACMHVSYKSAIALSHFTRDLFMKKYHINGPLILPAPIIKLLLPNNMIMNYYNDAKPFFFRFFLGSKLSAQRFVL